MGEWDDLLINTADLLSVPTTQSPRGAAIRGTPEVIEAGVACAIHYAAGTRTTDQGREGQRVTHRVYFGTDVGLEVDDLIRPTSPAGDDLYVLAYFDPTAGHGSVYCADCQERS